MFPCRYFNINLLLLASKSYSFLLFLLTFLPRGLVHNPVSFARSPALSPVAFSISNRNCSDKPELALVKFSSQMPKPAKPVRDYPVPGSEGKFIQQARKVK